MEPVGPEDTAQTIERLEDDLQRSGITCLRYRLKVPYSPQQDLGGWIGQEQDAIAGDDDAKKLFSEVVGGLFGGRHPGALKVKSLCNEVGYRVLDPAGLRSRSSIQVMEYWRKIGEEMPAYIGFYGTTEPACPADDMTGPAAQLAGKKDDEVQFVFALSAGMYKPLYHALGRSRFGTLCGDENGREGGHAPMARNSRPYVTFGLSFPNDFVAYPWPDEYATDATEKQLARADLAGYMQATPGCLEYMLGAKQSYLGYMTHVGVRDKDGKPIQVRFSTVKNMLENRENPPDARRETV